MEYLATCGSTHKVLKAEKMLKEKELPFKLIPLPKKIAAFCDLAITFDEKNRKAVEDAFRDGGIKITGLYKKEGDEYVKMQFLRQGKRNRNKNSH